MLASFVLSRKSLCPSAQQHFHDSLLNLLLLGTEDSLTLNHKTLINSHHQCFCCGAVLLLFHQTVKNGGIFMAPPTLGPINVTGYDSCSHERNSRRNREKVRAERERMNIYVKFLCSSADLRVPRITVSASWGLRLWQINTLPLDLTKHKYFNVPNGCWLWSKLSGAPNFCKHSFPLGNSSGNVTSSRPRYLPEGRCICLYMYKLMHFKMREDLNWSHWIGEYVLIRICSFFSFLHLCCLTLQIWLASSLADVVVIAAKMRYFFLFSLASQAHKHKTS